MSVKSRSLTVRLLKETVTDPEVALKDSHRLQKIDLDGSPDGKILYAGQVYTNLPKWCTFFSVNDQHKLSSLLGAGAGALLFTKVKVLDGEEEKERWLAISFGMGHHALNLDYVQNGFGKRVALNKIGKGLVKSLDTRKPEESTIQTRVQNSKSADILDFGIEVERIILHSITGKCSVEDAFATVITGNNSLKLSTEVSFSTLDTKCAEIVKAYLSTDYQSNYPWFENITPIKDSLLTAGLDAVVVQTLKSRDTSLIHLAPPEIVDYHNHEKFKYTTSERNEEFDEINVNDYLDSVDLDTLTVEDLKRHRVRVQAGDSERFFDKWRVYDCIVFETVQDGYLFVFSNGEWYQVAATFADRVNQFFNEMTQCCLDLPDYTDGDKDEGGYNKRVAASIANLLHFDKDLVSFKGERGRVEFCDLLTTDRQLLHVKKRGYSSNLSHLFFQGYVSAEALLEDPNFRRQIRETLGEDQLHLVPETKPTPSDYEIVYALIHDGPQTVPFFSKVSLQATCRQLHRMGYKTSLKWISRVSGNG